MLGEAARPLVAMGKPASCCGCLSAHAPACAPNYSPESSLWGAGAAAGWVSGGELQGMAGAVCWGALGGLQGW